MQVEGGRKLYCCATLAVPPGVGFSGTGAGSESVMSIYTYTTDDEKAVFTADSCRWLATRQPWELTYLMPFVVSPSKHERLFDMLRASGLDSIFAAVTGELGDDAV
jgi:hypothetical protein